jgi:hypothetical protein
MADPVTANLVMRDTKLPIARELAEMFLIELDPNNSLASLTLWSEMYKSHDSADDNTKTIIGSLFRDGITQFVNCFDSKNIVPLVVETVFPTVEGITPYFRWLRALRNSYTAHRHGAARQCIAGVMVHPVSGEYVGWGRLFAVYTGPSQEGHAPLLSLIRMAINYVQGRIEVLGNQFETEAKALGQEALLRLPPAPIQAQAPTDMSKSRGDVRAGILREHDDKLA